jgi:cytochrome c553
MLRSIMFSLLLGLSASALGNALTVSGWQGLLTAMPLGDAERGKALYEDRGCSGCHGTKGVADSPNWPVLAGQRPLYLYKMLLDYHDARVGGSEGPLMASVAAGLEPQESADLSAWLASLPRPRASDRSAPPAILRGDRTRLLPPCEACHGANGQGWDLQPVLTGQNRAYLEAVLTRFKRGERSNDINSGMGMIARRLTEEEIRALADFYGR